MSDEALREALRETALKWLKVYLDMRKVLRYGEMECAMCVYALEHKLPGFSRCDLCVCKDLCEGYEAPYWRWKETMEKAIQWARYIVKCLEARIPDAERQAEKS